MSESLSVSVLRAPEEVASLREEWNARALAERPSLYRTFEWVDSLWLSHFDRQNVQFLVLRRDGRLEGVVPITRRAIRKGPLPLTHRGLLTNSYGRNHNDLILFGDPAEAFLATLAHLRRDGWDVFLLGSIPDESPTRTLVARLESEGGYRAVVEPYAISPYRTLEGTWEDFLRGQSANFRADLKRKWVKVKDLSPEFRHFTKASEVPAYLDAVYRIEESSWKEGSGTSITTQPSARRFYDEFLPRAAANGWFLGIVLELEGEPAAYDMGILLAGKYYMLKTSYAQRFRDKSPGIVLRQHVMPLLYERGIAEHDFLGDDEEWKMRWTNTVRRHANLYLYNRRSPAAALFLAARNILRRPTGA